MPKNKIEIGNFLVVALSFVVGTLVPIGYDWLAYDGFSISQPFRLDWTIGNKNANENLFFTVVKIANSNKKSVLIDDIQVDGNRTLDGEISEIIIKTIKNGEPIYAPLTTKVKVINQEGVKNFRSYELLSKENLIADFDKSLNNYLPIIVKGEEEILLGIQFSVNKPVINKFLKMKGPKKLAFRVNGKFTTYPVYLRQ